MLITLRGQPVPIVGRARIYVCGITPYDTTHMGHAATFVWSDIVVRLLRRLGVDVEVARNITDVDDVLVEEAKRRGEDWRSMAVQQTYRFEDDVARLHVLPPTHEPRAHDHIDDVIALAHALLAVDRAYVRDGCVFFRGRGVAEAAGLSVAEAVQQAAARGDHPDDSRKDDPLDVPVWLASTGDAPAWDSPWGRGRPGWHAECSAMAIATLGTGIDLHCGGSDLAFPHHAYEAAQAEAALGVTPFARAWLRPGTVLRQGEKMSKSTGNLVFVHDVLEEWSPGAVRLAILDRPWAGDWEFGNDVLDKAEARLQGLRGLATRAGGEDAHDAVLARLADDLDVSGALEVAEEAGGAAAELLIEVLGLRHHEAVARSSLVPSR